MRGDRLGVMVRGEGLGVMVKGDGLGVYDLVCGCMCISETFPLMSTCREMWSLQSLQRMAQLGSIR